jgi:hypothetical protein
LGFCWIARGLYFNSSTPSVIFCDSIVFVKQSEATKYIQVSRAFAKRHFCEACYLFGVPTGNAAPEIYDVLQHQLLRRPKGRSFLDWHPSLRDRLFEEVSIAELCSRSARNVVDMIQCGGGKLTVQGAGAERRLSESAAGSLPPGPAAKF